MLPPGLPRSPFRRFARVIARVTWFCADWCAIQPFINGVLLKPLSYPDPERLVTLHGHTEKYGDEWGISYLNFLDLKHESRSLTRLE
jgi:hypothetical protein